MKKATEKRVNGDELRPEYDLTKLKFVGRGVYAKRFRAGTNIALLDRDVREAFPDNESVNEALRVIAKAAKQQASRLRKAPARNRRQPSQLRRAS